MDGVLELHAGQRFKSFQSVSEKIVKYMKHEKFLLSMTNNKKLQQVCKNKQVNYNVNLIYDEIYYKCPRAGEPATAASSVGPRDSKKTGCPAHVTFRSLKLKQELVITSCSLKHNHENPADDELNRFLQFAEKRIMKVMADLDLSCGPENNTSIENQSRAYPACSANENFDEKHEGDKLASDENKDPSNCNSTLDSKGDNFEFLVGQLQKNIIFSPEEIFELKVTKVKTMLTSLLSNTSVPTIIESTTDKKRKANDIGNNQKQGPVKILKIETVGDEVYLRKKHEDELSLEFVEDFLAAAVESEVDEDLFKGMISFEQTDEESTRLVKSTKELTTVEETIVPERHVNVYTVSSHSNTDILLNSTSSIDEIALAAANSRGRPKGARLRAIGLPKSQETIPKKTYLEPSTSQDTDEKIPSLDNVTPTQTNEKREEKEKKMLETEEDHENHEKVILSEPSTVALSVTMGMKFPEKYSSLSRTQKIEKILTWLIRENTSMIRDVIDKEKKISRSEMDEIIAKGVTDPVKQVNLLLIRGNCEPEAFSALRRKVNSEKKNELWTCPQCQMKLSNPSIQCNACLHWWDIACTDLKTAPKGPWFCSHCSQC